MELDEHVVVLGPWEGETVADRDRRTVVIKAARAEVTVTESRYAVGERGPGPHVHRLHADAFHVLSGALVFRLGPALAPVRLEAGGFVLVPPGVVHTFRNEGPGEATFLDVHAPDCGFAESLRGRPEGFDSFDPPADGGRPAEDAVLRGPGEGERIEGRARSVVKAGAGDGIGSFFLLETAVPAGYPGPPRHLHEELVECFRVVEGSLALEAGGAAAEAGAGAFALVPPGVPHTFRSDAGARVLLLGAPGAFERFLRATASEGDPARLAALAAGHDFRLVRPER